MAVITHGAIADFSISIEEKEGLRVQSLSDAGIQAKERTARFAISSDRRGVALGVLAMGEGFPGFIGRLFNLETEFYFLAWTWDMKGVNLYPGESVDARTCLIPLRPNKRERRFIGEGAILFPPQTVTAGIAVRIQVWESKQGLRNFGQLMKKVGDIVSKSELSGILAMVAAGATGGALVTVQMAEKAAAMLAQEIGGTLAETSDRFVDYFEGYFSAAQPWATGSDTYTGKGSDITLNRII